MSAPARAASEAAVEAAVRANLESLHARYDDRESTVLPGEMEQAAERLVQILQLFPQMRNAEVVTEEMMEDALRISILSVFSTPFYTEEETRALLSAALLPPPFAGADAEEEPNWMAALLPYVELAGLCSGDPLSEGGRTCAFHALGGELDGAGFEGTYSEEPDGPATLLARVPTGSILAGILDHVGSASLASLRTERGGMLASLFGAPLVPAGLKDLATHNHAFTTFLFKYRFDWVNVDIWGEAHNAERILVSSGEADILLGILPFGFEVKIFDRDIFDLIRLGIEYFTTGEASIGGQRWPNWPRRDWGVRVDGDIKSNFNRALECLNSPIPVETSPVYLGIQALREGRSDMFPGLKTSNFAPRHPGNEYAVEIYPRPIQVGQNSYGFDTPVGRGSPVGFSTVRWFYFEWLLKAAWYQDFFLTTAYTANGGHGCRHDWRRHSSLVGKKISANSPRYDADLFWSWDARGSGNPHGLPTVNWWASFWAR